jgi:hypothetical protein
VCFFFLFFFLFELSHPGLAKLPALVVPTPRYSSDVRPLVTYGELSLSFLVFETLNERSFIDGRFPFDPDKSLVDPLAFLVIDRSEGCYSWFELVLISLRILKYSA